MKLDNTADLVGKSGLLQKQRIFVNRSLNLAKIQMVGFDMDHTLAPYSRDEFEALAFRCTVEKFVEAGYPEELLTLKFNPDFVIRGLLVDRERGNLLKVDSHKYVKIAYHGHKPLAKAERHTLYNKHGFKAEGFLSVDTLFSLSEVQLFVEIVDYMERNPERIQKTFLEVYDDLRHFIDLSHRDGSIKSRVVAEPERYVCRDKYLGKTLVRLIDSGKRIFLLTNSIYEYTMSIMDFVLNDAHEDFSSWRELFDLIVVGASKPGFFLGSQPFYDIVEESNLLGIHDGPLESGKIYHGGNAKLFEELTGHRGDEILYVGDHIYGDIIQSKGSLNWRTLVVVDELEQEIDNQQKTAASLTAIDGALATKELLDEELQKARSKITALVRQIERSNDRGETKRILGLKEDLDKWQEIASVKNGEIEEAQKKIRELIAKREAIFHPIWGALMKVGLERSRFADQVGAYACLYTSKVSNLRFYGPHKSFVSFHETLPHDV